MWRIWFSPSCRPRWRRPKYWAPSIPGGLLWYLKVDVGCRNALDTVISDATVLALGGASKRRGWAHPSRIGRAGLRTHLGGFEGIKSLGAKTLNAGAKTLGRGCGPRCQAASTFANRPEQRKAVQLSVAKAAALQPSVSASIDSELKVHHAVF